MISFLLERKIAVVMTFMAILLLGLAAFTSIPVALLPNIPIPRIVVRTVTDGESAETVDRDITTPLKRYLMQVSGVNDIHSQSFDDISEISMQFAYGTDIDLALIAVTEKIDAALTSLPANISRPVASKVSATDVPVTYLQMTLSDTYSNNKALYSTQEFIAMGKLAENTVRRRLEQLPSVAFVDITGVPQPTLQLHPDKTKMQIANVTTADLWNALQTVGINSGHHLTVKERESVYDVSIKNLLHSVEDIRNVVLKINGRRFRLKDFCHIEEGIKTPSGYSVFDGKQAITLAVIKQSDENMRDFQESLSHTLEELRSQYPQYQFSETQNQTTLLDYTINNLIQNLVLALILVVLVTLWFIGDGRISAIVSISIVVSLVITSLIFYIFHVSFNIISLCGLILVVGMMVDNSLIVTDNINQIYQKGISLKQSCAQGATEMITPLLSSTLTTIIVFVPLVFMSGIAGAMFFDQAFSISVGLLVSYVVCITLLPVLFFIFKDRTAANQCTLPRLTKNTTNLLLHLYDRGISTAYKYRRIVFAIIPCILVMGIGAFFLVPKELMPQVDHDDTSAIIDWGEYISAEENLKRVRLLSSQIDDAVEICGQVGRQDYMLNLSNNINVDDASIYIKHITPDSISSIKSRITNFVSYMWPEASVTFRIPETVFEKVFPQSDEYVVAHISTDKMTPLQPDSFHRLSKLLPSHPVKKHYPMIVLEPRRDILNLYGISDDNLWTVVSEALSDKSIGSLPFGNNDMPVIVSTEANDIHDVLSSTLLPLSNSADASIALSKLINIRSTSRFRNVEGSKDGAFTAISYNATDNPSSLIDSIRTAISQYGGLNVSFSGSYFTSTALLKELTTILLVCIVLMYFILCAQFENFIQPLIVLVEIPIDIAFTLIVFLLCGESINLMSAIGLIVSCGIIVNDSILKIDTINTLRNNGMTIDQAIHTAGHQRLRAIIMTSLTTIVALLPVLFTFDLGSQLQKPLAIAIISTMAFGTIISIFILPLLYRVIYSKNNRHE